MDGDGTTPPRPSGNRTFLPEVQALRALAVLLVVVYHLWPRRFPGGFVGVDVFFVISGFLITSHLHREVRTTGRVRLGAFYARRARRLLPAALTVLLVTTVASVLVLPETRWSGVAGDVLASTFSVQNWVLADRAVDYSAAQHAASVVQHFWSLSVEEQFYLAWPPLVLLLLALAGRAPALGRDGVLVLGIGAVSVASLGWSVHLTAVAPAAAYFVTPTRIWELGAGALLALVVAARRSRGAGGTAGGRLRAVARWAGLGAIGYAAWTFSSATPFPGTLALVPVLGTVAVIAAGDTGPRDPSTEFLTLRCVQFLGTVSYPLYLWHWPAIVLAPFALGHALWDRDKAVLLVLCVALAWGTTAVVEDRAQRWTRLASPRSVAVGTAAAMLAISAVAGLQLAEVSRRQDEARTALTAARTDPCFGAAALTAGSAACGDPHAGPDWLLPLPEDRPWHEEPACAAVEEAPVPVARCRFGAEEPTRTVALVGDSHAQHWRTAVHRVARAEGWEVVEAFLGGCPATTAQVTGLRGRPFDPTACREWNLAVEQFLDAERPDTVITSAWAGAFSFEGEADGDLSPGATGFARTWEHWRDAGAEVVVIRDVPSTGGRNLRECLVRNADEPLACSLPRERALAPDAMTEAAGHLGAERVRLVDLSDYFCDAARCHAAVGGAGVYYDIDHMSGPFGWSLGPALLDRLDGRPAAPSGA